MSDIELLTAKHLAKKLGVSPATLYRLIQRDSSFPKPVKFSARCVRYRLEDVTKYVQAKQSPVQDA